VPDELNFWNSPYAPRPPWSPTWKHPSTGTIYSLCLRQPRRTMTNTELDACFSLVRATSRKDYEGSSRGWDKSAKMEEMRHPDLRYILVKDAHSVVQGFTSMMPTIEEGQPVVYCYEIHLEPELRGTGLAKLLMGFLETVAYNIDGVDKLMLTVFTCNQRALEFYQKTDFVRDDISPQPRILRGGKVKLPEYQILSKRIEHRPAATTGSAVPSGLQDRAASPRGEKRRKHFEVATSGQGKPAKIARLDCAESGL
jgi:N-alpha-acetyltransferase 40